MKSGEFELTAPASGTGSTWIVTCFLETVLSEIASCPAGRKSF